MERRKNIAISSAGKALNDGYFIDAFFTLYHYNLGKLNGFMTKTNGKGKTPVAKKIHKARRDFKNTLPLKEQEFIVVKDWLKRSRTYLRTLRNGDPGKNQKLIDVSMDVAHILASAAGNLKNNRVNRKQN